MHLDFTGKVVLVTGGGSGIGRAACLAFARAGARVVIADRGRDGAEETARLIEGIGGQSLVLQTDVAHAADCEAMVRSTVTAHDRLDIAFNNAGTGGTLGMTADRSEEDWDLTLAVNLKGVWLSMKYELTQMMAQGGGVIVNNASLSGLVGFRMASAYAASKHGVVGLTRSAALEYARHNIRINAVCPGFTETPMVSQMDAANPRILESTLMLVPMRRLGTPDEIADAVLWLASTASSFVTGQALAVDGGFSSI
jgi:NAD(P)-dependent dehydrogenase (short-subunit alcohol dehydrogenase family)